MSAIVITIFVLVRLILPLSVLIALGEWIRRRETNYWFPK